MRVVSTRIASVRPAPSIFMKDTWDVAIECCRGCGW
jgi:hypothetical protein